MKTDDIRVDEDLEWRKTQAVETKESTIIKQNKQDILSRAAFED